MASAWCCGSISSCSSPAVPPLRTIPGPAHRSGESAGGRTWSRRTSNSVGGLAARPPASSGYKYGFHRSAAHHVVVYPTLEVGHEQQNRHADDPHEVHEDV